MLGPLLFVTVAAVSEESRRFAGGLLCMAGLILLAVSGEVKSAWGQWDGIPEWKLAV